RSVKGRGASRRVRRHQRPIRLRMTAAIAMAAGAAAIVWIAGVDHIAAQLYRGVTPPAVTAVPIEPAVPGAPEVAAPVPAPRELTPFEAGAVEDALPSERRAPAVMPEVPAAPPRVLPPPTAPSASAPSPIARLPRAAQSAAPIPPRPPVASVPLADRRVVTERPPRVERDAYADDGSGAIAWLLKRQR